MLMILGKKKKKTWPVALSMVPVFSMLNILQLRLFFDKKSKRKKRKKGNFETVLRP